MSNSKNVSFNLDKLPGYDKDKTPEMMKSLSNVYAFSSYLKSKGKEIPPQEVPSLKEPTAPPEPQEPTSVKPKDLPMAPAKPMTASQETPKIRPGPIENPDASYRKYRQYADEVLKTKTKNVEGQNTISQEDYSALVNDVRTRKEDEFKEYQKMIGGNLKSGEGTRKRFADTSQKDVDFVLSKNNVSISSETANPLEEAYRRFKLLTNL